MDITELLVPCVSPLWIRRVEHHAPAPTHPTSECFLAAVLLADVSGFTPLTERLAQRGSAGAEELSRLLEQLFAPLVEVVTAHGGEILNLPGDALLAVWPAGPPWLADAVLRAAQCGLALQRAMQQPLLRQLSLSLRVAVGAGEVQELTVGGTDGRWQTLVRGQPFVQLRSAERAAAPGEVVLSREAWRCAEAGLDARPLPSGDGRVKAVRGPAPRPLPAPRLPPGAHEALRPFVSRVLRAAQEVGTGWLAELRRATVLFLRLDGLPEEAADALLPLISGAVRGLQEALYTSGGSVNQLLVDDKGLVLLAAFGLPTCAHEDDAARAVKAAHLAREALRRLGLSASIGIATGRVCCGLRGGARRYEYALMGRTVNLAARLMQRAREDILLDEATAEAVGEQLGLERLPPVAVKGVAKPVPLFRSTAAPGARPPRADPRVLVGRVHERALLDTALEDFTRGQGGVLLVEAEAGMGKSRLMEHLALGASTRGVRTWASAAEAPERATVYYAWRPLFTALLGLPPSAPPEARRAALEARLAARPDAAELAPLLNPLLLLELPETARTEHLRDQARADTTLTLLIQLLGEAGPGVLLLEDAHWLDSSSWELVRRLARDLPGWLLVLATRPFPDAPPPALEFLQRLPSTRRLVLPPLADADILALVCARLGVARLHEAVAVFIQRKAEGHPFYSEELAYTLRDRGLLRVEHGEGGLAPEAGELEALGLPSTLEGLITSRIDRLTTVQQLTLKAASVIGRTFARRLLGDVHPLPEERERLEAHLRRLQAQDLTLPVDPGAESSYLFKHVITQEVAYNLLLFSQRQRLHAEVARWYEHTHAHELTRFYPLLAHHWRHAGVRDKALEYLEKAGEHALRTYAPSEAVTFFSQALEVDAPGERPVPPERRARWERRLGRALRWLGRPEARDHLLRALELLGHPLPSGRGALALGTLGGAARQWLGWMTGLGRGRPSSPDSDTWGETVETYSDLALIAYYELDLRRLGYLLFHMANAADRSGVTSLRARAYASLTVAMGTVPLHRAATAYSRASLRLAAQTNDPAKLLFARLSWSLYLMEAGRFAEARSAAEELRAGFTHQGHLRQADEAGLILLNLHIYAGRLDAAEAVATALVASAREREDSQLAAWAREDQGRVMLRAGRNREALEHLRALALGVEAGAVTSLWGSLAQAWLRAGEREQARAVVLARAEHVLRIPVTAPVLDGYEGMAEVSRELWLEEAARGGAEAAAWERLARRFCEGLERGAWTCAMARPAAGMCRGLWQRARGRHRAARRSFESALRAARELDMPRELATAHRLLARPGGLPEPLPAPSPGEHGGGQEPETGFQGRAYARDERPPRALSEA